MQSRTATALLLDVRDLQERDRIVAFLTAEWGQKRGVAKGARAKYSRFAGQLQPLAKVRISWFEKDGRDLVRIGDVALSRPAAALQADLEGILLGSYLAEHMLEFATENEASPKLFRLLDTTLEALLGGVDPDLAARYYEIWVLRLSGIFPAPWECPLCGREITGAAAIEPAEGAIVCAGCAPSAGAGAARVAEPVLDLLRRAGRENLAQLAGRPPTTADLRATENLCARVRRSFLQQDLKSYRVMRRTLATVSGETLPGAPAPP